MTRGPLETGHYVTPANGNAGIVDPAVKENQRK